jgi:hypothetical protein
VRHTHQTGQHYRYPAPLIGFSARRHTSVFRRRTDVMVYASVLIAAMKTFVSAPRISSSVDQRNVVFLYQAAVTHNVSALIAVTKSTVLVNHLMDRDATMVAVTCQPNGVTESTTVATTPMNSTAMLVQRVRLGVQMAYVSTRLSGAMVYLTVLTEVMKDPVVTNLALADISPAVTVDVFRTVMFVMA